MPDDSAYDIAPTAGNHASSLTTGSTRLPIAVVGMSCRLPGGLECPDDLWDALVNGRETIGPLPEDRGWDIEYLFDEDPGARGKLYVSRAGFLDGAADFDAGFFGIAPREAVAMDPQQRVALETAWHAFEDARIDPRTLAGTDTGTFVGCMGTQYGSLVYGTDSPSEGYMVTGNHNCVISGRIAYTLDLRGPAITLDTACSSSLVAVHLAANALQHNECDLAIAGGVTLMPLPETLTEFSRQRGLAKDGRCKSFAQDADGTVFSEGSAFLVLERLDRAVRNGRRILGVVVGTATNQDGASATLVAPSQAAQERVVRAALRSAGLRPDEVDYVEAHGTGTRRGDPIEASALAQVFAGPRTVSLLLGSGKTNVGHTQAAAGAVGIIKVLLSMRHGVIPRTLHLEEPSGLVDWDETNLSLVTANCPWPEGARVRRAGVSGFGMSGSNCHVVLEEWNGPTPSFAGKLTPPRPWTISARGEKALNDQVVQLLSHTSDHGRAGRDAVLDFRLAHALAASRSPQPHRLAITGGSLQEKRTALIRYLAGERPANVLIANAQKAGRVGLVFPGQGSLSPGMAAPMYRASPVFGEAIDEVLAYFGHAAAAPVRGLLLTENAADRVPETVHGQRAIFTYQVAAVRYLASIGVSPYGVVGHSAGEFAAAHTAGIFDLATACDLLTHRSRLMQSTEVGAMASVNATADIVEDLMAQENLDLDIAAINSPSSVVISGDPKKVDLLCRALKDAGHRIRPLLVNRAFHSRLMATAASEFAAHVANATFRDPQLHMAPTLRPGDPSSTEYWPRQIIQPVQFGDAIGELRRRGVRRFIEVGPRELLAGPALASLADSATSVRWTALSTPSMGIDILQALEARLFVDGAIDRLVFDDNVGPVTVDLPLTVFCRERYWPAVSSWASGPDRAVGGTSPHETPAGTAEKGVREDTGPEDRLSTYRIIWNVAPLEQIGEPRRFLLLATEDAPESTTATKLAKVLSFAGDRVEVSTYQHPTTELVHLLRDASLQNFDVVALLPSGSGPQAAASAATACVLAVANMVKASGFQGKVWFVTSGAVQIGDDLPPYPHLAQAWGAARTFGLEHPEAWGGLVDLSKDSDPEAVRAALHERREDSLAVRGNRLFVRRIALSQPHQKDEQHLAPNRGDAVVITGGAGAIGRALAEHMVGKYHVRVFLLGRRPVDQYQAGTVQDETQIAYRQCDVTDSAAWGQPVGASPRFCRWLPVGVSHAWTRFE